MTRVLALPRYTHKGASSRVRTLQYIDELSRRGIEFRLESLLDDVYLDDLYAGVDAGGGHTRVREARLGDGRSAT